MGGLILAILGMVLIVALPLENSSGRLAGYYLTQAVSLAASVQEKAGSTY